MVISTSHSHVFILQLGSGNTQERGIPDIVSGFSAGTLAVALSATTTCVLFHTGALSCFGYNFWGQVGL